MYVDAMWEFLKDTVVVLDSSPRSMGSIKSPSLRTESSWAIFQR